MQTSRYFFDRVSRHRSEYDYLGREFATPEKAFQLAELIALDLGVDDSDDWSGWAINVRNAVGHKLFSVPVPQPDLAAA